MSKQIHFVVVVDLETKEWFVDDETFMARFGKDEGTWNTETQTWESTTWRDNITALGILNPVGNNEKK